MASGLGGFFVRCVEAADADVAACSSGTATAVGNTQRNGNCKGDRRNSLAADHSHFGHLHPLAPPQRSHAAADITPQPTVRSDRSMYPI